VVPNKGWNASDVDAWYASSVKAGISEVTLRRVKANLLSGVLLALFRCLSPLSFFSRAADSAL
jgi:hypothetical protein